MATSILILGESGSGKSTSIRTLNPEETFIINVLDKPLPFKGYKNQYIPLADGKGNYKSTDDAQHIIRLIEAISSRCPQIKNIVIDDFQYVMANEFMRRATERGYDKFTEIGRNAWSIIKACNDADTRLNCFILTHSETSDSGTIKVKTIGKMLDDKIVLEGMVTVVLHALVQDGQYKFLTQHDGTRIAKSPVEMFADKYIDNDLSYVQLQIEKYCGDV